MRFGLDKPKRNLCFEVNGRFWPTFCVTLYNQTDHPVCICVAHYLFFIPSILRAAFVPIYGVDRTVANQSGFLFIYVTTVTRGRESQPDQKTSEISSAARFPSRIELLRNIRTANNLAPSSLSHSGSECKVDGGHLLIVG